METKRWSLVGVALAGLAAAVTIGYLDAGDPQITAGPLDTGASSQWVTGPMRPHKPLMWGDAPVFNRTDQPIVIDKVTLPTRVPSVVKKVVATGSTAFQMGFYRHWPPIGLPASNMERVGGAVIQPHHLLIILIELAAPGVGVYQVGPIIFDYHIGNTHYRKTLSEVVTVCSLPDANGKNRRACGVRSPTAKQSVVIG